MRRVVVLVTSIAVVVVVAVALTVSTSHHGPVRPAGVIRTAVPATAPAPPPTPSATFDADAFLNALTRVDGTVANQLIDALSPADRAALANDVNDRIGAAMG